MNIKEYLGHNLLFLISKPRSGSTMVQRMLGAHSNIYTVAEPWLMLHPLYAKRVDTIKTEYNAKLANRGLNDYLSILESGNEVLKAAVRSYAQVLYGAGLEGKSESIFLDKTPRYYLIIEELLELFPEARFVLLKRNPLAVLASILKTWVGEDYEKLWYYKVDLTKGIDCLLSAGSERKGLAWMEYETLVIRPEEEMKRVADKIGISFEKGMVEYGRLSAPPGSMGDPVNAGRFSRPTAEFVDSWVKVFSDNPIYRYFADYYLECLGPQRVRAWGYDHGKIKRQLQACPGSLSKEEQRLGETILKKFSDANFCLY